MSDLAHATRRMLQALDGYWEHWEGLSGKKAHTVRGSYTSEDWWHRFEGYRKQVETILAASAVPGDETR